MATSTIASDIADLEKNYDSLLAPAPITLSWSGLTYEVNGKTILSGVDGHLESGQLLAVMGPSGKHKPSLLHYQTLITSPRRWKVYISRCRSREDWFDRK